MSVPQALRCAVYTRKSSEEGLQQSFNSLDAQRQACQAYVRSQQGEGWSLRGDTYDDGGFSGASLNRPALRRLLADVAAGGLDVVVVYKVDRLTRSLGDFVRIIEIFDKANVSFVSVTQAFNTTTSMGRLTLNVLLSFAQFEREITGERIRDKIAASKAKGMWLGGAPPLGYNAPTNPMSRALVVDTVEAEKVRLIFRRYLELANVYALQKWLDAERVRSKRRTTHRGVVVGGCAFSRGALTHLLSNPTYLGRVTHKGTSFPGSHDPIVDPATFDAAQKLLLAGRQKRRERVTRRSLALLDRLLFDSDGQRMELVVASSRKRRLYQYYCSPADPGADSSDAIRRVPADVIHELLKRRLGALSSLSDDADRDEFRALVSRVEVHPSTVQVVVRLKFLTERRREVGMAGLRRRLMPGEQLTIEPHDPRLARIAFPVRLKLRGGRRWIVGPDGQEVQPPPPPDVVLIRRVQRAHGIIKECQAEPDAPLHLLRFARSPSRSSDVDKAQWAFLAPDLQKRILRGESPTGTAWIRGGKLPLSWSEQRTLFDKGMHHA